MKAWLIRIAALLIFAASFLLPAIRVANGAPPNDKIPGWTCALVASITGPKAFAQSLGQHIPLEDVLLVLSGLVNYLFLAVFVLSAWRRLVRTRLAIGALIIPCFIATWMFFASQKMTPLAGHYLWIAGAILMVAPDIVALTTKGRAGAANANESAASTTANS